MNNLFKSLYYEFIGTFLIFFLGGSGTIMILNASKQNIVINALFFSVVVIVVIFFSKNTDSIHFSPVVSFSFFLFGKIKFLNLILRIMLQIFAGFLAGIFLILIFKNFKYLAFDIMNKSYFTKEVSPQIFLIIINFFAGLFLSLAYLYNFFSNNSQLFKSILIGLIYFIFIVLINGLNPVRYIFIAVLTNTYSVLIPLLLSSFLGGILSNIIFFFFYLKR